MSAITGKRPIWYQIQFSQENRTDLSILLNDVNMADDERVASMAEIMAGAIDASVVGDMVLQAILNDDAYIFPHPNIREQVERRMQA